MALACLAQLDRSHRRHDDVMAQLLEAARRLAAGRPHDTDVDAVHDAVRYFERSVTRHFLDEEGSVFPRLSTRRPELAEALAALSAEHPAQIALQNAVAECARQLTDAETRPGVGKALLEVAERLAEQHRSHVAKEDEIFSSAESALTAQDDADIAAEMETRRDRDSEDGGGGGGGGGGRGRGMGGGGGGGGRGRGMGGGGGRQPDAPVKSAVAKVATAVKRVAKAAKAKVSKAKSKSAAAKSAVKSAAKKSAAKKSAAKKPVAKKPPAKPVAKKSAAKRASR
jgi:hemerythrin-like domain-containing protein